MCERVQGILTAKGAGRIIMSRPIVARMAGLTMDPPGVSHRSTHSLDDKQISTTIVTVRTKRDTAMQIRARDRILHQRMK